MSHTIQCNSLCILNSEIDLEDVDSFFYTNNPFIEKIKWQIASILDKDITELFPSKLEEKIQYILRELLKNSYDACMDREITSPIDKDHFHIQLKVFYNAQKNTLLFIIKDLWTWTHRSNTSFTWWSWEWETKIQATPFVTRYQQYLGESWSVTQVKVDLNRLDNLDSSVSKVSRFENNQKYETIVQVDASHMSSGDRIHELEYYSEIQNLLEPEQPMAYIKTNQRLSGTNTSDAMRSIMAELINDAHARCSEKGVKTQVSLSVYKQDNKIIFITNDNSEIVAQKNKTAHQKMIMSYPIVSNYISRTSSNITTSKYVIDLKQAHVTPEIS